MLNGISLRRKLTAMVAVPVAGLVLFASADLAARLEQRREMILLEELTRLAREANAAAGALHDERSLTAGALTAEGPNAADLDASYSATDAALGVFHEHLSGLDPATVGEDLHEVASTTLEKAEGLEAHRSRVASGELTTAMAVSFYNELNRGLLRVIALVSRRSSDTEVKTRLLALDLLAQLKEAADLERAALSVAFTADSLNPGLAQAVVEIIAQQEVLERVFLAQAPEDCAAAYQEKVVAETLDDVVSMRLDAIDGSGAEQLGISPQQWWRASSLRISAISKLGQDLAAQTLDRVETLHSQASRGAWRGALLVLIAVSAALALSVIIGRTINSSLTRASDTIRESVGQILSSVQQLTTSTAETAAAVSQTSTTVDELRQTSEAAATKAESSSDAAESSRGASQMAQQSATSGVEAMQLIREEVEGIAERIVDLSERHAQISDIVENVNAIAEQSNLLAVNASIEAAKAGEHGRGFAVVASEVRSLAERSKEATQQIRSILSEIQRSSNSAVMVTEQGVKRVDRGNELIAELGHGVETLARTIQEGSEASQQISLISSQQLAGIRQITDALRNVEEAASGNAAGAQQLEEAARKLQTVSERIVVIVRGTQS